MGRIVFFLHDITKLRFICGGFFSSFVYYMPYIGFSFFYCSQEAFGGLGIVTYFVTVLLNVSWQTKEQQWQEKTITVNKTMPSKGQWRGFWDYPLFRLIFTPYFLHY